MHKFEKFLAFYSTVVILVLIFGSVTFLPRPHNYIMLSAFLPICMYFWLRVTAPEGTDSSKWSIRLLLVLVLLSGLGIFGYFLNTQKNNDILVDNENKSLKEEITSLKNDLREIKDNLEITPTSSESGKIDRDETTIADVLSETDKPAEESLIGYVEKMPSNGKVDIYEQDSASSEIISEMKDGTKYPFYEKAGNYYLIGLGDGVYGYVKVNLVKQTVSNP